LHSTCGEYRAGDLSGTAQTGDARVLCGDRLPWYAIWVHHRREHQHRAFHRHGRHCLRGALLWRNGSGQLVHVHGVDLVFLLTSFAAGSTRLPEFLEQRFILLALFVCRLSLVLWITAQMYVVHAGRRQGEKDMFGIDETVTMPEPGILAAVSRSTGALSVAWTDSCSSIVMMIGAMVPLSGCIAWWHPRIMLAAPETVQEIYRSQTGLAVVRRVEHRGLHRHLVYSQPVHRPALPRPRAANGTRAWEYVCGLHQAAHAAAAGHPGIIAFKLFRG